MMKTAALTISLILASGGVAKADYADEFSTGLLSLVWSFTVPGNVPPDTKDASSFAVLEGKLNIVLQRGIIAHSSAHNVPTVTIAAGSGGDYRIETKVFASFDKVAGYPLAGIVVLTDNKNFIMFGDQHNDYQSTTNYNFANVMSILGGKVNDKKNAIGLSADYTNLGTGPVVQPVTLTLKKNGQSITFNYASSNGKSGTALTLNSTDTGDKKAAYDFLSNLSGKHVGLFTDDAYTGDKESVGFDYFRLTGVSVVKH